VSFASWRGTVGVIKPTFRPGSLEEFIKLIPDGIACIPLFIGFQQGTVDEFKGALDAVESKVAELVKIGVDLVHPEGAPPFMVHGARKERELLAAWRERYGVPVITSGTTQVDAMRALELRRIVGVTYFKGEINDMFAQYFTDNGFEVLAMDGIEVPFADVGLLSSQQVYAHTRVAVRKHSYVDGVYMLGAGWRILDILQPLEQDLAMPVVQATPCRVWAVQKFFGVRERHPGYGKLLEELPGF
jgi:maleate cis-trans isomerase